MFTVFIQQPPIHIIPLCLFQHYLYQLNVMYHTNVISNLLHLHSYLMITLLYHCTINTFLHCISLLFVFLFRVHALLQHHSHDALLSKYNYHILLNIHMHSL